MSVRIAGGAFAGRLLLGPPRRPGGAVSPGIRPTAVRLRKSLFEVLGGELSGVTALDVCAGVGTLGFEALSRGARRAVFLERDPVLVRRIGRNAARLGVESFRVLPGDAGAQLRRLAASGWDFEGSPGAVFFDPPWADFREGAAWRLLASALGLGPTVAAVEHERSLELADRVNPEAGRPGEAEYVRVRTLTAGDSAVSLYRPDPEKARGE